MTNDNRQETQPHDIAVAVALGVLLAVITLAILHLAVSR